MDGDHSAAEPPASGTRCAFWRRRFRSPRRAFPTTSRKTDLGFVPLLHLAGDWRLAPSWRLGLDVDALAGGPGRAEDAALTMGRDLGEAWTLTVGYRTVEGGADVDEVYAFAWLHYAVVEIERRF